MPRYVFEDVKTCEVVELDMPMSESVPIGEVRKIGKRRLRRLCESAPEALVEPDWAHKSYQLGDEQIKYAPHVVVEDGERYAAFRNKREILNFEARLAEHGITERYDFGHFRRSRR